MIIIAFKIIFLFTLIIILFILGGSFFGQIMDRPMKIVTHHPLNKKVISLFNSNSPN